MKGPPILPFFCSHARGPCLSSAGSVSCFCARAGRALHNAACPPSRRTCATRPWRRLRSAQRHALHFTFGALQRTLHAAERILHKCNNVKVRGPPCAQTDSADAKCTVLHSPARWFQLLGCCRRTSRANGWSGHGHRSTCRRGAVPHRFASHASPRATSTQDY